jgi:plasmid segregation protein ParM
MNKNGLVNTNIEGGLGILDLGGLTIDCVAFNEGELIKDSPISFSGGVRKRIFKKIQDSLAIDISQDIIKRQILDGKDYIEIHQDKHEFGEIKQQAANKLAHDIARQVKNRWQSLFMIDKILITGGASILLFDELEEYLDPFPCEQINKKPQFSNCRGYVKLGLALKKKKKKQVKEKMSKKENEDLNRSSESSSPPEGVSLPQQEIAASKKD